MFFLLIQIWITAPFNKLACNFILSNAETYFLSINGGLFIGYILSSGQDCKLKLAYRWYNAFG